MNYTKGVENNVESREGDYNPEDFGLSRETVYDYRKRLFAGRNERDARVKESDGIFLYSRAKKGDSTGRENGGSYFGQVAQGTEYASAVTDTEARILSQHPEIAHKLQKYRNHIELGPGLGTANKFKHYIYKHFLQGKKLAKKYKHYGFDVAGSVTAALTNSEYDSSESIEGVGVNEDWFKTDLFDKLGDKAYYILGGSIGNFDDDDAVRLLKRLSSDSYRKGSTLVLSRFMAPSGEDREAKREAICQSYKTKEGEAFIMKGLEALGIDRSKLEFEVVYEEGDGERADRVRIGARVTSDIEIDLGPGQPPMIKKAGEHIRAISSRRYSEKQFEALAEKAGCKIKKTWSEESMAVTMLESPAKKPSQTQTIVGITGLALLALLSLRQGITNLQLKSRIDANQRRALEESFAGGSGTYNQLQLVLGNNFRQAERVVDLLKLRYNADLSSNEKEIVKALFYDRSKNHKQYTEVSVYGRGQPTYDTRIYNPDLLERFVWDMQHTLLAMGISSVPNEAILEYKEELRNTYHYQGPRKEFEEVEQKLPSYGGYFFSEDQNGKVTYQENNLAIVSIDGKRYIAVQARPGAPYVVDERPSTIGGFEMNPQKVIINVLQRGRVLLLAEKIREFLVQQYSPEYQGTLYTNGQIAVVNFLTDLYVQGYNFDYLLGGDDLSAANHRESAMRSFVLGYVMPELGSILKGGGDETEVQGFDKMYLDRDKLENHMQEYPAMNSILESTVQYIVMYAVPPQSPSNPELKSRVLKELLLDANRQRINRDYEIRPRLIRQRDMLHDLGIRVPEPADWIRSYSNHKAPKGFTCPAKDRLLSAESHIYLMQDGSWIIVRELRRMAGKNIWVGKKVSRQERQQIYGLYNGGKDQRPRSHPGPRGVSTRTFDIRDIVLDFVDYADGNDRSADTVTEAYQDYTILATVQARGGGGKRIPRY